jgi:4-hydroxy-tetrahydrodipicolinate synthase
MTTLHGTFAAVPTPFDEHGRLDLPPLARHLRWLADEGLEGALVLGSNGEFPSLELAERRSVAEAGAAAGSGLRLILNVGSCALGEAVELARLAADLGYDGLLCPPPFYFRQAPHAGLVSFLRGVLDASRLPVLLYHIPQATGVPVSDELLEPLEGHPCLAGVKDSSGDPADMARLVSRFATRSYLTGNDRLLSQSLSRGGAGSITATANVAPSLVAAVSRDASLQARLDAVRSVLERHGLLPAAKAILRRRGFGAYRCRPPLVDLEPEAEEQLLREAGGLLAPGGEALP